MWYFVLWRKVCFFLFLFCLIHLIKDWEPELLTQLSTKLCININKTLASFVAMPCVGFLAWPRVRFNQVLMLLISKEAWYTASFILRLPYVMCPYSFRNLSTEQSKIPTFFWSYFAIFCIQASEVNLFCFSSFTWLVSQNIIYCAGVRCVCIRSRKEIWIMYTAFVSLLFFFCYALCYIVTRGCETATDNVKLTK